MVACDKQDDACVGEPNLDCLCIEIYAPVCGCDDITYSNECHATCAGVQSVTEGECN